MVVAATSWPRKGESPADSIFTATFKVPLPDDTDARLDQQLHAFLNQDAVITTRMKKNRPSEIDLRPWVHDLKRQDNLLWMEMHCGSPLFLAAFLLNKDVEDVRSIGICKTGVALKEQGINVD
mgnify:CR=1 FL=1